MHCARRRAATLTRWRPETDLPALDISAHSDVAADSHTPPTLQKGIAASLKDNLSGLFGLAGALLRAPEPEAAAAGSALLSSAFLSAASATGRQDALVALLAHAGSGSAQEVRGALGGLLEISEADAGALLPFASFLNSLLDYLDKFDDMALQARDTSLTPR